MNWISSLVAKSIVAAAVFGGPVASTLQAQSNLQIRASISFPFIFGTRSIAPGSYQFTLMEDQFLLSVLNVKTGRQELFSVHPGGQQILESNGCLMFQKSDDFGVLTDLQFPGAGALIHVNGPRGVPSPRTRLCSKSEPLSVVGR